MPTLSLSPSHISHLIDTVLDWQYTHGSLLKLSPHRTSAQPIGTTLFPTEFPRRCFEEAVSLQPVFNKLYAAVAADEEWLYGALKGVIEYGGGGDDDDDDDGGKNGKKSMAKILWDMHCALKEEEGCDDDDDGGRGRRVRQDISLGVFRSDYMLHVPDGHDAAVSGHEDLHSYIDSLQIKQVEFNTCSVAGGAHGERISNMHKYLQRIGAYGTDIYRSTPPPENNTVNNIAAGLAAAHAAYGAPTSTLATSTAVLMVVQPYNVNVCDERPIQEKLWELNIPCYRVEFGEPTLASTVLAASGELLYRPGCLPYGSSVEISVVYHRAGYDVEEYQDDSGLETRYQLEKSRAIKCPSLLGHMATLKLVQQRLAVPGVLERFLRPDESARVRATFAPMYPLDDITDSGRQGSRLALDPRSAVNHVLKPCLEGGGHNIYREAIPAYLTSVPKEQWGGFVLMEMIRSPLQIENYLLSFRGLTSGPVISELGVFGTCLWRRQHRSDDQADSVSRNGVEIVDNCHAGFSFKTKSIAVQEMSVVKGFGCFDSPRLV